MKAGEPFWDEYPKGGSSGGNRRFSQELTTVFSSEVILLSGPNPWAGRSGSQAEKTPQVSRQLLVSRLL